MLPNILGTAPATARVFPKTGKCLIIPPTAICRISANKRCTHYSADKHSCLFAKACKLFRDISTRFFLPFFCRRSRWDSRSISLRKGTFLSFCPCKAMKSKPAVIIPIITVAIYSRPFRIFSCAPDLTETQTPL